MSDESRDRLNRIRIYGLALLALVLDQLTKFWVVKTFLPDESRDLIPGFFSLTYVRNTGGAFGILQSGTLGLALAAAVAAVAIILFTWRARRSLPWILAIALALPLGGALGNLCDRLRLRYVVDFLDVHVGAHQWPVFNVADSAICIGVCLLAVYFWRLPSPQPARATVAEEKT